MMNNDRNNLPSWITAEALERVMAHYDGNNFVFDLPTGELCETVRGTTYHVVPHYAGEGAEDIIHKLRRIMSNDLPKD